MEIEFEMRRTRVVLLLRTWSRARLACKWWKERADLIGSGYDGVLKGSPE